MGMIPPEIPKRADWMSDEDWQNILQNEQQRCRSMLARQQEWTGPYIVGGLVTIAGIAAALVALLCGLL